MATPNLNFSVVANNDVMLEMTVLDSDGNGINGTGMSVKWTWFITGQPIVKESSDITVVTANPLVIQIPILAADTLGAVEGYYPHEAVTVNGSSEAVTITNNDQLLTWGTGYVRRQLTVQ